MELCERLKWRVVLIISGHDFLFGLEGESWTHRRECLWMTFTMDEPTVKEGIAATGEGVAEARG